jgi:anti-anti-sigma factor
MAGDQVSQYFDVSDEGEVTLLEVIGPEIRHPTPAAEFAADALRLIQQEQLKRVVINLHQVEYMSSTGFATLINLARKAEELGCEVKLCAIHPEAEVGANIIGLPRIVPTFATEDEAIASFGIL